MTANHKNWRKESKNTYSPLYFSQDSSCLLLSHFSPAAVTHFSSSCTTHSLFAFPQAQPSCSQQEPLSSPSALSSLIQRAPLKAKQNHIHLPATLFYEHMMYSICTVSSEQIWKTVLPSVTTGFTRQTQAQNLQAQSLLLFSLLGINPAGKKSCA